MQPEQEIVTRWTGSAPYWEKHREIIRQMFAPITQALVADAEIRPQHTVLDVATGPGEPALGVAALVGPQGRVVGIDPIPEMVAAARRAADHHGLKNTQFEVAFADHLPFPVDTFDAAISRFGVMFFPAPTEALREILRVLKPGAKLALAVWHFAEKNPFHYVMSRVVDRYAEPAPLAPDALDAFRFAELGKLREILTDAGVQAPAERLLQFTIEADISVEDFLALRIEMSDKLRGRISALSQPQVVELKREAREALREYSTDRGLCFPAEVLIVSGAKRQSS